MINVHVLYTPKGEMHLDQATAMELSLLGVIESYDKNYVNPKVLVTSYRPVEQAQPVEGTKVGDFYVGDTVRRVATRPGDGFDYTIQENGYYHLASNGFVKMSPQAMNVVFTFDKYELISFG